MILLKFPLDLSPAMDFFATSTHPEAAAFEVVHVPRVSHLLPASFRLYLVMSILAFVRQSLLSRPGRNSPPQTATHIGHT